jgi:hypothetical protein
LERFLSFIVVFMFYNKLVKKNPANIIFLNCGFIYWFVYLYCSEMYIRSREYRSCLSCRIGCCIRKSTG